MSNTMRMLVICAFVLTGITLQAEIGGDWDLDANDDDTSNSILYLEKRLMENRKLRILGGVQVTPHAYPFQVLLIVVKREKFEFCGGTLLSRRWVLTAAHCVSESIHIDIFLGVHHIGNLLKSTTQIFRSTSYEGHPAFDEQILVNDIAMVELPRPANLNDRVKLVTISSGNEDYAGEHATILGWGMTGDDSMAESLQSVTVEVMTNEACREYNDSLNNLITERHVCTSRAGSKGGCVGDSGGPLLLNGTQIGVVSFGPERCTTGDIPTVFTRLSQYKDWIRGVRNTGARTLEIRDALLGLVFVILALEEHL